MSFWRKYDEAQTTASGIKITDIRGDRPTFERRYSARINDQVSMEIKIKWFIGGTLTSGELTQRNGSWVFFDPERPADKILDREILPTITARCKEIIDIDREWRGSNPSEFTDERGKKWRRVE